MKMSSQRNDSSAQELYISRHKRHHHRVAFLRLLFLFLFLVIWELCADFDVIDSFFFSSPSRVVSCFRSMLADYSIFQHVGITLLETLASFLLVIVIGLLAAALLWFSKTLSEIMEPYLVILNSLPKSALAPLFIVWLGTGIGTIIVRSESVAGIGCVIRV